MGVEQQNNEPQFVIIAATFPDCPLGFTEEISGTIPNDPTIVEDVKGGLEHNHNKQHPGIKCHVNSFLVQSAD
jgi:hypothetical protein